jgi:hypothetical protein
MGLQFRMLAGRRGDVRWKKPSFLGAHGRRDYDTYEAWGFFVPFVLTRPIHVFASDTDQAILLRPDRGFVRRAYVEDWSGMVLVFAFLVTPVLALVTVAKWMEPKSNWVLYLVFAVFSAILLVGSIVALVHLRTRDQRNRDIRLLMGTHTWGSSDPAYWHTDLLQLVVSPSQAFGVSSFQALTRDRIGARDWCRALWAARLCCAVEDYPLGEALTTEILDQPDVLKILSQLRKHPEERENLLGPPIPLSTWVTGEPHEFIRPCSGQGLI